MSNLVEKLTKGKDYIVLSPGGTLGGEEVDTTVSGKWLQENFPDLARESTPLDDDSFERLKSIDKYWKVNAERWRNEGLL